MVHVCVSQCTVVRNVRARMGDDTGHAADAMFRALCCSMQKINTCMHAQRVVSLVCCVPCSWVCLCPLNRSTSQRAQCGTTERARLGFRVRRAT